MVRDGMSESLTPASHRVGHWLALPRLGWVLLRPLTKDDLRAYRAFGRRLEPEDLRLRFVGPARLDDMQLCARLLDIDHDRHEAFAAFDAEGTILAVARIVVVSPGTAEVAMIVRSDLKRNGLGRALLAHLLDYARSRGFLALTAEVLRENQPMLTLATQMGFRVLGAYKYMCEVHMDLAGVGAMGERVPRA